MTRESEFPVFRGDYYNGDMSVIRRGPNGMQYDIRVQWEAFEGGGMYLDLCKGKAEALRDALTEALNA